MWFHAHNTTRVCLRKWLSVRQEVWFQRKFFNLSSKALYTSKRYKTWAGASWKFNPWLQDAVKESCPQKILLTQRNRTAFTQTGVLSELIQHGLNFSITGLGIKDAYTLRFLRVLTNSTPSNIAKLDPRILRVVHDRPPWSQNASLCFLTCLIWWAWEGMVYKMLKNKVSMHLYTNLHLCFTIQQQHDIFHEVWFSIFGSPEKLQQGFSERQKRWK